MAGLLTDDYELCEDDIVVCRCKEITMREIRQWIDCGYDTIDELKRLLGICMGQCQGRGCREIIMREISRRTGKTYTDIGTGTFRPPLRPVKLGTLADANQVDPWDVKGEKTDDPSHS